MEESIDAGSATGSLADSFQSCSRSFKELYLALFAYGAISLQRYNDEYGRFGVWGGDSGADRTGRGSLDDVLRQDSKTTLIVAEVLENLDEDLHACVALVEASTAQNKGQSQGGLESCSDEESSVSSGSDLGDDQTGSSVPSRTHRILHLLDIIFDHVQSLYQVLALLRRPTISDKYLRSAYKGTAADTESPFLLWDLAHVTEKARFWVSQQKGKAPENRNSDEHVPDQISNYLCKRLAAANVRRREQLDFWQTHPAQPLSLTLPEEMTRLEPALTVEHLPTEQLMKKTVPRSEISKPSHRTKLSFSTVAISDLNDSATFSGRPRTEYVPSIQGGKFVLRVPPLPEVLDESPTLDCPYCSTKLDCKSMGQRELWKKHVFRDLRPYICTFEQCGNPEKLYLTRHDWIYHETQMHRRQWICASCSERKFLSRNEMKIHLLANHPMDFPESHLMTMVDICERPMDDDEDSDCPVCFVTLALSALRVHLATHLEEVALFVLPCHMDDRSQEVGSDKAEVVDRQDSFSDTSSRETDLPAFDSEMELIETAHLQDPVMFSTILQSQIEFGYRNIEDWVPIDHQSETQDDRDRALSPISMPEPEVASSQLLEEAIAKEHQTEFASFFSQVAMARQLQRIIEQLASIIVDEPLPKSSITVGDVLTTLESLIWEGQPLDKPFWVTFKATHSRVQTCITIMQEIIRETKASIRQPGPLVGTEISIWKPGIAGYFADRMDKYTSVVRKVASKIAEQDVHILQRYSVK